MAVTVDDVKKVYPQVNGSPSDDQYTAALETAQLIADEQLTASTTCKMSPERIGKITVYLAAHFLDATANAAVGLPAGGLRRSKLGEADESYATPEASMTGFQSSKWGQLALALDTCGILNASIANNGLKAQFRVVGGERS